MRMLSLFFILLFAAGVALQVATYRKERKVRPRRIIIMQGAALGSMIAFSIVTLRPPGPGAWVVLLGLGVAGGLIYGRFVNLRSGKAGVTMSYTLPWLITWGVLMAVTQLTAVLAQSVPVVIYGLAIVNLGVNLGMNGRILGEYRGLTAGMSAAVLPVVLLLGIAVVGSALPALAQPGPEDIPPEIAPAVIEGGGGTVDVHWLTDGDRWFFFEAEDVGPYIHFEYRVVDMTFNITYPDGYTEDQLFNRVVNIYWLNSEADAARAFAAWSSAPYENPAPCDLGFGLPTIRLDAETASYWSSFLVQQGSVLVHWKGQGGDQYSSPTAPGGIPATEHLAAILASVPQIDVDALRSSWYGTPPAESDSPLTDVPTELPTELPTEIDPDEAVGVPTRSTESGGDGETPVSEEPLEPGQAAAATALAGIILAGGSLVQLGDRLDIEAIRAGLDGLRGTPPEADALDGLPRSEDGRVLAEMPWDEGGPSWVSEEEARRAIDMQAQGYSWDNRWGWVRGEEAAERQANADLGREQWLQRDKVADAIVGDIMASRRDLAVKLAEMDRAAKLEDIEHLQSQAMIDNWRARIADNRYYWWSGISIASDVAFGLATGGLSAVKPIGQLALRGGMHMTAGYTQAWSESELDGRSWDEQAFAEGSTIGVVRTVLDFGVEVGLNTARTVMPVARAAWSGLRGADDVAEHLTKAKELLEEAVLGAERVAAKEGLDAGLEAVDRDAALELLREGRRLRETGASLADLEASGQVTREQARLIRQVWTEAFDESAEVGAKEVFEVFEQKYGEGLKEVLLGDQGSSATRFAVGSLKTDADRTVLPVFERELLERVAAETGETLEQVNLRLTDEVTEIWRTNTQRSLQSRNLTLDDFDSGSYSGFGRSATADDAYDAAWVMQRQGGGTTTVVRPGDAATYRAAGDTIVDQAKLNAHVVGAADETLDAARVTTDSAIAFLGDQAEAVAAAGDVKTAAKALARQAWAAGRRDIAELTGTTPDPGLRRLAAALIKEPQDQARLLREAGFTPESFLRATQEESARLVEALAQAQ